MRRFLHSNGRYGASSFLVGHYGGSGEIAQGFCRSAAVHGGVYILGRRITSIARRPIAEESSIESSYGYILELEDFPDQLRCNIIISSTDYLTPELARFADYVEAPSSYTTTTLARGIAIVDEKIPFGIVPRTSNLAPESLILEEDNPSSRDNPDTFVLVFPPASVDGGSSSVSVTALITGEGTMSAPKGKCKQTL
jgi:Rab proteins geranylgeranyltransferase component A